MFFMFLGLFILSMNCKEIRSNNEIDTLSLEIGLINQTYNSGVGYVPVQKFTDIPGDPYQTAADDFMIPWDVRCTFLTVDFIVMRWKYTKNPTKVTVNIFRTGITANKDGTVNFYPGELVTSKHFKEPIGGWREPIRRYLNGEFYEPQSIKFLVDTSEFNGGMGLEGGIYWLSFYADLDRDFNFKNYDVNRIFWMLTTQKYVAFLGDKSPIVNDYISGYSLNYKGFQNENFFFIDPSNLSQKSWMNWTEALLVEEKLRINSSVHNMAFSINGTCHSSTFKKPVIVSPTSSEPVDNKIPNNAIPMINHTTPNYTNDQNQSHDNDNLLLTVTVIIPILFIFAIMVALFIGLWCWREKSNRLDFNKGISLTELIKETLPENFNPSVNDNTHYETINEVDQSILLNTKSDPDHLD